VLLRHRIGLGRFTAVQRLPAGIVRVFGRSAMAVWDRSHWWEKPYADTYAPGGHPSRARASPSAAESILEFCVHAMSPSSAGATLVWALDGAVVAQLSQGRGRTVPPLSLEDRANHGSLRQLLSQVDGAALLSPSAELLDVGVYLHG